MFLKQNRGKSHQRKKTHLTKNTNQIKNLTNQKNPNKPKYTGFPAGFLQVPSAHFKAVSSNFPLCCHPCPTAAHTCRVSLLKPLQHLFTCDSEVFDNRAGEQKWDCHGSLPLFKLLQQNLAGFGGAGLAFPLFLNETITLRCERDTFH